MSERSIRRERERRTQREARRRAGTVKRATLGAGAALGATLIFAPAAQAANFQVTINDDEEDVGTTPCTDNLADCSLREAVIEANENGVDDTITFASSVTGTIALDGPNNPIQVRDTVSIQGPGAATLAVSGEGDTGIFYSYAFPEQDDVFAISGLTLRDGLDPGRGGALYNTAAGDEAPDLIISDSVLTANEAVLGGAVFSSEGSVTLRNSVISDNRASTGDGGGINVVDGGLTISDSVISGNTADGNGGGVKNYVGDGNGDPSVLIERSTFSGNTSEAYGGGAVLYGKGFADATIDASTFTGNTANDGGGGAQFWGIAGPTVVQNSTFSGNVADISNTEEYCCRGGGGISFYSELDEPVTVRNSTITGNSASTGGGVGHYPYDNGVGGNDVVTITSSIITGNTAPDGAPDLSHQNTEEQYRDGHIELGFSLIGSTAGATVVENPAGSNLLGVDPLLDPLQNNGGPTQTHLPSPASPAVDKGVANGLATDQRSVARTGDLGAIANATGGDGTDIGAAELQVADCSGTGALKIDGTEGDDVLAGSGGPDAISALGGNDQVQASGGNDCAKGGGGKDRLQGSAGKDRLGGDAGKDRLAGGGGKDKLSGGGGKDRLSGGGGKDRLKGGPGKDVLKGGGGKDRINCGGGEDKVTAQPSDKVSKSCETVVEKG